MVLTMFRFQYVLDFIISSVNMVIVDALPDALYRQRVQKRLIRLRKRLIAFVIKANPECFDHAGRLALGCFPVRIPSEAADLHGLMQRAECKLAMLRCHSECRQDGILTEREIRAKTAESSGRKRPGHRELS
jgi:hypothetical protein